MSSLTTFHLLRTVSSIGKVRAEGLGSPAMHSSPIIHDLSSGGQTACISNNVLGWLIVEDNFSRGRNRQGNPGKGPQLARFKLSLGQSPVRGCGSRRRFNSTLLSSRSDTEPLMDMDKNSIISNKKYQDQTRLKRNFFHLSAIEKSVKSS